MVYADNAATTSLSPTALAAMMPYFSDACGNPSSLYDLGTRAKAGLEQARSDVARCLNAESGEIFFTSCGSESDNWALRGVAEALGKRGRHILISAIEHHAILHTGDWLRRQGFEVEILPVDGLGLVRPETLQKAQRSDTILVSVMLANNEIGTIEPIRELAALAHQVAHGSVRVSLADDVTEEDVDFIIENLTETVKDLRRLSPVWDEAAQRPIW